MYLRQLLEAVGWNHRSSCHGDRWCIRSGFSAVAAHERYAGSRL